MHRDLSYQNIMLDSEGRCVVNDWDSAGPFTPDGGAVVRAPAYSLAPQF